MKKVTALIKSLPKTAAPETLFPRPILRVIF